MISKTNMLENLRLEIGSKLIGLISDDFINKILYVRVLPRFSDWYPLLCNIKLTAKDAIPYRDYSGKMTSYGMYRIPDQFEVPWIDTQEKFRWRDLEDFRLIGNDRGDVYSGGNVLLQSMFLSSLSNLPHTRSYFVATFREPDLIVLEPNQQSHRDFVVTMQADRTLKTIPRNMERYFTDYFVAQIKYALYMEYQYNSGSQTFNGIEIDTKIDELRDAKSDVEKLEEEFEKDYFKNPERFEVITLYQYKN